METESVTVDEGDPPVKKHEEAAGADAARAPRAEARTACMDVKVLLAGRGGTVGSDECFHVLGTVGSGPPGCVSDAAAAWQCSVC